MTEEDARRTWTGQGKAVFVVENEDTGTIVGSYYIRPNYDGPGAHVCNCGYAVSVEARGRGVASMMCEHSQTEAVALGYRAIQVNLVAVSNEVAVRLWRKLGVSIVGTLPGAFRHPSLGYIDALVMFKRLT